MKAKELKPNTVYYFPEDNEIFIIHNIDRDKAHVTFIFELEDFRAISSIDLNAEMKCINIGKY